MRLTGTLVLLTLVAALGCGGSNPETGADADVPAAPATMPDDDVHANAMGQAMAGGMHTGAGINAEVDLDPEIADDWRAIKVRVVDLSSMTEHEYEVPIGGEAELGDSGLTLRVETFVPDFVMGEDGITSRSAEPQNPAARVVITEAGKPDYEGWLFGAMPEIHPFPHDNYGVILVEAIPAE